MTDSQLPEKIKRMRIFLDQSKGQLIALQNQLRLSEERSSEIEKQKILTEKAQVIIREVAKQTQDQLKYRIEEPVSLAMAAVFDDPLRLKMEFPIRRGRTECDMIWVNENGDEVNDLEYCEGGGAVDVAAFGLQISVLALMKNRSRPILFLDEPLKWLKGGDLPEKGAQMMKEISKEIGVQIISVSHIPEQKEGSDRIFTAVKSGRVTKITMQKKEEG